MPVKYGNKMSGKWTMSGIGNSFQLYDSPDIEQNVKSVGFKDRKLDIHLHIYAHRVHRMNAWRSFKMKAWM